LGAPVNIMVGGQLGSTAPMSNYAQTPTVATGSEVGVGAGGAIIDGTPMRVATLILLAIFALVGLRWAGFKFNVTVGG
jgi:hypothetical protein